MKIEKSYEISFPVEVVYEAWTASTTVIAPATSMDIDPQVGGHYRLFMDTPDFSGKNEGVFSRVDPLSRLTYSWEWNEDGEVSIIDVRFSKTASGTRIELTHSGFSSEDSRSNHDSGWDNYIQGFTEHLENSVKNQS